MNTCPRNDQGPRISSRTSQAFPPLWLQKEGQETGRERGEIEMEGRLHHSLTYPLCVPGLESGCDFVVRLLVLELVGEGDGLFFDLGKGTG